MSMLRSKIKTSLDIRSEDLPPDDRYISLATGEALSPSAVGHPLTCPNDRRRESIGSWALCMASQH